MVVKEIQLCLLNIFWSSNSGESCGL